MTRHLENLHTAPLRLKYHLTHKPAVHNEPLQTGRQLRQGAAERRLRTHKVHRQLRQPRPELRIAVQELHRDIGKVDVQHAHIRQNLRERRTGLARGALVE